jgi:hypothetical protein
METYEKIIERRKEDIEFQAKMAGAEIKQPNNPQPENQSSLIERLRKRKETEMVKTAKTGKPSQFSDGVAYRVI